MVWCMYSWYDHQWSQDVSRWKTLKMQTKSQSTFDCRFFQVELLVDAMYDGESKVQKGAMQSYLHWLCSSKSFVPTWLCLATRVPHGHSSSQWRLNNTIAMACCCCPDLQQIGCLCFFWIIFDYETWIHLLPRIIEREIWRNIVEHDINMTPSCLCLCKENGPFRYSCFHFHDCEKRRLVFGKFRRVLRKNLLTNGPAKLYNYELCTLYNWYHCGWFWRVCGSWQESSLDDKLPELVALHGNKNGCAVELSPCAWPWCFPFGHRSQLVLQHRCGAEESHENKARTFLG